MIKEHLVSTSITNGAECICNPDILLGTNYGLWDYENELAPRGALMDLNAAWELFLSRQRFSDISFQTIDHYKHEVVDGVVYEDGDTTYILKDDKGNPTGATFTIKANKGPIEHIEWEKGKLYLYYTKLRPIEDKDLEVPIHYVLDEDGNKIIDKETGRELVFDYAAIPVLEIFDNDETRQLFPWFADEENTVRLRSAINGNNGQLGRMAITSNSEVFIAKESKPTDEVELVSVQSVLQQLNKDLGFEPVLTPVSNHQSEDGISHNFIADGSTLLQKLSNDFNNKETLVDAINEDLERTRINTQLLAGLFVENVNSYNELLKFADDINSNAFRNTGRIKNLLDALNWILEKEIGKFKTGELNPLIKNDDKTVETITEALNVIFEEAEKNKKKIGFDSNSKKWYELTTDKDNLILALNEVDEHTDALANVIQVRELYDALNEKTYYSNPNLNTITKNRLRPTSIEKDNVTIIEAINELQSEIGNLSKDASKINNIELTTDNKNSLVEAINEVNLHADNNAEVLGAIYSDNGEGKKNSDITNLLTLNKANIVSAINELTNKIGDPSKLNTEDQQNLVNSINEVIEELPFIYDNSGVVLKNASNSSSLGSLVVGKNNTSGKLSLLSGENNKSTGDYSLVSGLKNENLGNYNTILGELNYVKGNYNLVNGKQNVIIEGDKSIVSGQNNQVKVDNSIVLGNLITSTNKPLYIALGKELDIESENSISIGNNSTIHGNKVLSIGSDNDVSNSESSIIIGNNNDYLGIKSSIIGNNSSVTGNNSSSLGESNSISGDKNYIIGTKNLIGGKNNHIIGNQSEIHGQDNILIGHSLDYDNNNAIIIGELNSPQNDATNIGRNIYIQTHETESLLQKLIFVDLNDWCKNNNSALLNGEKFLTTQHVVNALKVYISKNYTDQALLRFTMLDNNENGYIVVQGKSARVYLNGSWYFTDNILNGWSRHEGEYLKVINKPIVDSNGNLVVKHYLAFMDLLSTEAIVDTVGGQRSNTEDFGTIDLTHAYGAVDIDDIEEAMDLEGRFNKKVDKSAKIIAKYQDENGVISEKVLNFVDTNYPSISSDITLDLKDSFGFDKFEYQRLSEKGKKNGYVPLDSNGKIDSDFLPSYVDDVIDVWAEYTVASNYELLDLKLYELIEDKDSYGSEVVRRGLPLLTGEKGKIYVEAQPKPNSEINYLFRWTGTKFIVIGTHIFIGESEGTAFDGARGKTIEDSLADHLKSGVTTIPIFDEETGNQKTDSDGNPMWVTYKPNPHNVTAEQLSVVVNDPNNPDNVDLEDSYPVELTVDSALKDIYNRLNSSEDNTSNLSAIIGSISEIEKLDNLDEELGNLSPSVIALALNNKEKIDSFEPLDKTEIASLVNTYLEI